MPHRGVGCRVAGLVSAGYGGRLVLYGIAAPTGRIGKCGFIQRIVEVVVALSSLPLLSSVAGDIFACGRVGVGSPVVAVVPELIDAHGSGATDDPLLRGFLESRRDHPRVEARPTC